MESDGKNYTVPVASHASEFLASERTFLAWIRTSVSMVGLGFAIIKFDAWTRQMLQGGGSSPSGTNVAGSVGALMVILGGAMSAIGAWHYRRTNRQIVEGRVRASNWLVLTISGCVCLIALVVIVYLFLKGEY